MKNKNNKIYNKWTQSGSGCLINNFPVYIDSKFHMENINEVIDKNSCYWLVDEDKEEMKLVKHKHRELCKFCNQ